MGHSRVPKTEELMNEPIGEKITVNQINFQLDRDLSKVTRGQIKSYLNDGLMTGKVPPREFVDNLLDVASNNPAQQDTALLAFVISLGDLHFSSRIADGNTYEVLNQGKENKITQGVIEAISKRHIENLRTLYVQERNPPFANEAYLLSLRYAPKVAEKEDIGILCKGFEGLPPSPLFPVKTGESSYYSREILEIMNTAQEVMEKRPELVDPDAFLAVHNLPERIKGATYFIRPSFDRDINKTQLETTANKLYATVVKSR